VAKLASACQQLVEDLEVLQPKKLLLEGADSALGHPVALRLSNEGGRAEDGKTPDLGR
jgi:hypothetical protein